MFMTIQFAYKIDQLVFYLSEYRVKYGRVDAVKFSIRDGNPEAEYFINLQWRKERHLSTKHLELINQLLKFRP